MHVKLDKVEYVYQKKTVMEKEAVSDLSLEIQEGEFVSLLGQTGCGKSTLLSIISKIEKPFHGTVEVDCPVSMMFQNPENQLFDQTVVDDVLYGPRNMGLSHDEAKKVAEEYLHLVGLDEQLFLSDPSILSGGQKRKVALAGILAMQRPLVLLDEPTAGLDNKSAEEIMSTLLALNKKGVTIVMATHDFDISVRYASRVIVMNEGSIEIDGKPQEIIDKVDKLSEIGINIPGIYQISSLLYKNGLISDRKKISAQDIFESLKINKK